MEPLLDTSWTLYYTSKTSAAYNNLFTTNTTQNHLSRYFDRLTQYITTQRSEYKDDFNDETEKLGSLRDIEYTIHTVPNPPPTSTSTNKQHPHMVRLQVRYQNTTFNFILHTPHLLLIKAPTTQTKLITTFLCDTFNIAINQLKLPSLLLSTTLHNYLSVLTTTTTDRTDPLFQETRAAILRSAIGTLKLTISFSSPISPHLKTLDLSIPYETVDTLLSKAETHNQTRPGSSSDDNNNDDNGFMHQLVKHIHLQTGLKLPLTSTDTPRPPDPNTVNGDANSVTSDTASDAPLRIAKMTTAAFAISVEGRLRFAAKAIDSAIEHEDLVVAANMGMLDDVVRAAIQRQSIKE